MSFCSRTFRRSSGYCARGNLSSRAVQSRRIANVSPLRTFGLFPEEDLWATGIGRKHPSHKSAPQERERERERESRERERESERERERELQKTNKNEFQEYTLMYLSNPYAPRKMRDKVNSKAKYC